MDKKIWTDETTELLATVISDAVKSKVPFILRPLTKPATKVIIGLINTKADAFVPDSIDDYVNSAINLGYEGKWDEAAEQVALAADLLIDIPSVEDEYESKLFVALTQAIVNGIRVWIEKGSE